MLINNNLKLNEVIKQNIALSKKIKINDIVWLHYWGTNDPRKYIIKHIMNNKVNVIHDIDGPLKNAPEETRMISEIISIVKN